MWTPGGQAMSTFEVSQSVADGRCVWQLSTLLLSVGQVITRPAVS